MAFSTLTAAEAVSFARNQSNLFFGFTSPSLLEAIPDYSQFTPEDLKAGNSISLHSILLEIESAVKTMPIKTLGINGYNLSPRAEELVQQRLVELACAAIYNLPLRYQYVLLHDSVPMKIKMKGKKKHGRKASESPAEHQVYGSLIGVTSIIKAKPALTADDWAGLVFAYAVYTGDLTEQMFASIIKYYWKTKGLKEETFLEVHSVAIGDLKKICEERFKLLQECESENLKTLLYTPLSKQVRDALQAVNEHSIDLLVTKRVLPAEVQQWLWAYVGRSNSCFTVKSTKELVSALTGLASEFEDAKLRKSFLGRPIVSIFLKYITFGEDCLDGVKEQLLELKNWYAHASITDYGDLQLKFPELLNENSLLVLVSLQAQRILQANIILTEGETREDFVYYCLIWRKLAWHLSV